MASLVDGRPVATATGQPLSIRATAPVAPPMNGPRICDVGACSVAAVEPPEPPSATYRAPSGPQVNPRGVVSPVATGVTGVTAIGVAFCATATPPENPSVNSNIETRA